MDIGLPRKSIFFIYEIEMAQLTTEKKTTNFFSFPCGHTIGPTPNKLQGLNHITPDLKTADFYAVVDNMTSSLRSQVSTNHTKLKDKEANFC